MVSVQQAERSASQLGAGQKLHKQLLQEDIDELRQEDKSTAILEKERGNSLGQNRPCKLKNKGAGGLSPRDKKPGSQE